MPFCSQCGNELEASARFCPSCGASAGAASAQDALRAPAAVATSKPASAPATTSAKSAKIVAGVLNVVLIVCAFMPWVNVNLYVWRDAFSIPGLLELSSTIQNYGSSLGGSAYSDSSVATTLGAVTLLVLIVWLVVLVFLGRDAYRYFSGKRGFSTTGAAGMCSLSALSLLVLFAVDQLIASNIGGVSGLVTATLWVWASIGLSIVLLIFAGMKESEFNEKGEK